MKIKQFLCLLLSLAFLIPSAHAKKKYYSIQDVYEQAKDGWHQSYEAYGRTVNISTDVRVPEVQTFPVQKMEFAFSEPLQQVKDLEQETIIMDYLDPWEFAFDTLPYSVRLNEYADLKKIKYVNYPPVVNPRELDKVYVGGEEGLTLGEVMQIAREGCEAFGVDPNGFDIENPYLIRLEEVYDSKTDALIVGQYHFTCNQILNGIPIYSHAYSISSSPHLSCLTFTKDEFNLHLHYTLQTGEVLQQDVPLLGFDAIKKIIEKEITEGHIRHIYDLNLGYLLYDEEEYYVNPDTAVGHYYALPAWNLRCLYLKDPHKELPDLTEDEVYPYNSMESVTISINAQTGELLHRKRSRRHGDSTFVPLPDILTWDAVGGKP